MNRKMLFMVGTIGNAFESFEMIVYLFLQEVITATFFPVVNRENQILFWATAIIPLVARPIGFLVFGFIADIKGRTEALEYSMLLSGISCFSIALIPAYSSIGIFSLVLLVLMRFLFGLSMSGVCTNSILYLTEHAEPRSRAYILSWIPLGIFIGIFFSQLFSYGFTVLFNAKFIPEWSWRCIFGLSFINICLAFLYKKQLKETAEFFISYPEEGYTGIWSSVKSSFVSLFINKINTLKAVFLVFFGFYVTYTGFFYSQFHLQKKYGVNFSDVSVIVLVSSFIGALVMPMFGKICGVIGRKGLILLSTIGIMALFFLFFFTTDLFLTKKAMFLFYVPLYLFSAAYFVASYHEVSESLPETSRAAVIGMLYTIAVVAFGTISLPYFQKILETNNAFPFLILIPAIAIIILFLASKERMFVPTYRYNYALEQLKVK